MWVVGFSVVLFEVLSERLVFDTQLLFAVGLYFFQYDWAIRDLGFIRVT